MLGFMNVPPKATDDTMTKSNVPADAKAVGDSLKAANKSMDEHVQNKDNPHSVTAKQVGLGNVPNVATNDQTPTYTAAEKAAELTSGEKLSSALGKIAKAVKDIISHIGNKDNPHGVTADGIGAVPTSQKGAAGGVAPLGTDGQIASKYLPSYVDDVLEFDGVAKFPQPGEKGKIYIDTSTNIQYRWGGSKYVEIAKGSDTTYMLTKVGSKIKLTGSDGSETEVEDNDTVYTHPTEAGNKHIPSGGKDGQILTYGGESGTAKWEDLTDASTEKAGLMSAADKAMLESVNKKVSSPNLVLRQFSGISCTATFRVPSNHIEQDTMVYFEIPWDELGLPDNRKLISSLSSISGIVDMNFAWGYSKGHPSQNDLTSHLRFVRNSDYLQVWFDKSFYRQNNYAIDDEEHTNEVSTFNLPHKDGDTVYCYLRYILYACPATAEEE